MKTIAYLAVALAASALPMPDASVQAQPAQHGERASEATRNYGHIRTTLHGQSGSVIVLIPGMSTPGSVWDPTVEALKANHRLLVVEVKGFDGARTPANEQPGLMDGIVDDLVSDLRARGIERATLVGHSFGGLLSLKLAMEHPALAQRLLIVDALPFFGTLFDPSATVETSKPRAEAMRQMMLANADTIRGLGVKGVNDGSQAAGMSIDEATRTKIANWSVKAEPTVVAQAMYEDILTDYRQQIAQLKMPVTVLYQADNQRGANAARYEQDYAALPQARLVGVSRAAHFIQLDRPDLFMTELERLLEK